MKPISVFVNVAIGDPDTVDGVHTDAEYAHCDRLVGFETIPAVVVSETFLSDIDARLGRIQEATSEAFANNAAMAAAYGNLTLRTESLIAEVERLEEENADLKFKLALLTQDNSE